jgi:hypothetical protein
MKLNIGCGQDYRDGFINIDGRDDLPKIDMLIHLGKNSLLDYFSAGSVDYLLANDFIEHHFHWQAVCLLEEFFLLLSTGGTLEMRLPDCDYIVHAEHIPIEQKITLLFGGQDIPQGESDPLSRERFPEFFCHKYGYARETMRRELQALGFVDIQTSAAGTNFIILAKKP